MATLSEISQVTRLFSNLRQLESVILSINERLMEPIHQSKAQATLTSTIAKVSREFQLSGRASMVLRSLFEATAIPSDTNIYSISYSKGRDPQENSAVRKVLKDAPALFHGDLSTARNYYLGILFNAILKDPKANLTWQDAEKVFDANCNLMEVPRNDYRHVQISAKGEKAKEYLKATLFKSHDTLKPILEKAKYPEPIMKLLDKYQPKHTHRKVTSSDKTQASTLEDDSRILQEPA